MSLIKGSAKVLLFSLPISLVVGWLGLTAIDRFLPQQQNVQHVDSDPVNQDLLVDTESPEKSPTETTVTGQNYQNVSLTAEPSEPAATPAPTVYSTVKETTTEFFGQWSAQLGMVLFGGLLLGYFVPRFSSKLNQRRLVSKDESMDLHAADTIVRAMAIVEDAKRLNLVTEKFPEFEEALSKLNRAQWESDPTFANSETELASSPSP